MGDKSYTDTSRDDFHCGKYKKVDIDIDYFEIDNDIFDIDIDYDIPQKTRKKRNSVFKEDQDQYSCGATIIADK